MGIYKRKLKRGLRWYYSGQYLNQKYHSKAIYHSKIEAKRAESIKIQELDETARRPFKDMPLKELMNDRLDFLQLKKSIDYYKENRRYFKKALQLWGNVNVSQITKVMVNNLLMDEAKRLKKIGKSNQKVNSMLRSLRALFNYAIKIHDLKLENPCNNIEFYSVDIPLKYIPKDEDIDVIKKNCNKNQRFLIDFVEETGCRIMEAVRLNWNDVDKNLITLWTRKAKNSNLTPRRIPRPNCLIGKEKGQVFKDWNSYPRFLEATCKELDIKSFNWHNLRHRAASRWASEGMSTFEIMVRLGHQNLQTTMNYLQLLGFTRT